MARRFSDINEMEDDDMGDDLDVDTSPRRVKMRKMAVQMARSMARASLKPPQRNQKFLLPCWNAPVQLQ